jgi:PTS system nitrogen regulatory IIA component
MGHSAAARVVIDFKQILAPSCVAVGDAASTKQLALEHAAALIAAANPDIPVAKLVNELAARERLGSTGLGEGIAIPHCRLAECAKIVGALMHLAQPVQFDAIDGRPVDVLFALVVPASAHDAHLKVLAELARVFADERNRDRLRAAPTAGALFDALISMLGPSNA